ncbi:hypothetical protein CEUSTIGMA_g11285.t1 [Chlamydomonas eustigma]|uniref:MPN domain-containing protein n=1 Tax=Chlamydomonas eustigma TaxID=1157962 RepID=A0A250XM47_9CHLO|nr:hypothetical protein CEUSTIGMA_g11285.t1 [Chlamydomonas eustigma]|eukprot:GAX83860.1 hypothetical protein CEUSTIGMA_g11285.t1 [Chlamydomonas eustigma]
MPARVDVTEEVILTCMTHAFSTEGEEIMGLLLGDIEVASNGETVTRIWMAYPQIRTDRRKDRVETSPEQIARSSAHAERLSIETGVRTRIIGWYHSHPHITVLPSHVDVRTQAMYQMLDEHFVGLIFSVFNGDATTRSGRVQVTAFQSVSPDSASAAPQLLSPISSTALPETMDSPLAKALHASTLDIKDLQGSLVRREVPLSVVKSRSGPEKGLQDLIVVQRTLCLEEKGMYQKAVDTTRPNPGTDYASSTGRFTTESCWSSSLSRLHHAAAYQQSLCYLLSNNIAPTLQNLTTLSNQQKLQMQQLNTQNDALKAMIQEIRAGHSEHHRCIPASATATHHHLHHQAGGTTVGVGYSPRLEQDNASTIPLTTLLPLHNLQYSSSSSTNLPPASKAVTRPQQHQQDTPSLPSHSTATHLTYTAAALSSTSADCQKDSVDILQEFYHEEDVVNTSLPTGVQIGVVSDGLFNLLSLQSSTQVITETMSSNANVNEAVRSARPHILTEVRGDNQSLI